jgi:Thymidylate synthase
VSEAISNLLCRANDVGRQSRSPKIRKLEFFQGNATYSLKEQSMDSGNIYEGADEAFSSIVKSLLDAPHLEAEGDGAQRTRQGSYEQLNYSFLLNSPRRRLSGELNAPVAAARFVWMMSANNRLADIAFYEPKVMGFTDDGLTVPGSSYGMRLRQPQPGVDQIAGAISRLKDEKDTRRAAVSIFQPIDAIRESKDIPCAFGIFFHNRDGFLKTTILMRSNNAWDLLPFNMFELSMLAEVIAVEAGLKLGEMTYFAGSMHLYDRHVQKVNGWSTGRSLSEMTEIPQGSNPLAELTELGRFEAELRHSSTSIDNRSINEWLDRVTSRFSPYWSQFGFLLLAAVAASRDQRTLDSVRSRISALILPFVPREATASRKESSMPIDAGPLFGGAQQETNVVVFARPELRMRFAELAKQHEEKHGMIGSARLLKAQGQILDRLAARGETEALSKEVFEAALNSAG